MKVQNYDSAVKPRVEYGLVRGRALYYRGVVYIVIVTVFNYFAETPRREVSPRRVFGNQPCTGVPALRGIARGNGRCRETSGEKKNLNR